RNVAPLDLLALDYLTRRYGLPRIGFTNDLGQWLRPTEQARRTRRQGPAARLRETLAAGESAVLFLKGPPAMRNRASPTHRGRTEGEELLRVLIDSERSRPRDGKRGEIMMVPQIFVWTQRPERLGFSVVDTLFGPSDFPGELRAAAQVLFNYKNGVVRS